MASCKVFGLPMHTRFRRAGHPISYLAAPYTSESASVREFRILPVTFDCATCGVTHQDYIPESWIEEGKAVFVEWYVKGEDTEEK
jgi:hypothetical protein